MTFLKISSSNRLQDLCNLLQALKFELKRLLTAGNRLQDLCNRLDSVKFEFKFLMVVVNHLATGNRLHPLVIDYQRVNLLKKTF